MSAQRTFQFVLEIRREIRWFEFEDIKGRLIDRGVKEGFTKVKNDADRIILTDDNYDFKLFVANDNVGIQLERLTSYKDIEGPLKKFYNYLEKADLIESLNNERFRFGTKVTYFYSPARISFTRVKKGFRQKFFGGRLSNIENGLGIVVDDTAVTSFLMDHAEGKLNLNAGPVEKKEALTKYFQEKQYRSAIEREAGFFAVFDYFRQDVEVGNFKSESRLLVDGSIEELENLSRKFEAMFADVR